MSILETTECIPIENSGRNYTDCMEFSLLRFVHMIYYFKSEDNSANPGDLDISSYNQNITLNIHSDLKEFINRFTQINTKGSYYLNGDGIIEREEWAKFVSDRPYFDYYRTDGAELFTSVKNIIIFCKELLGINLNLTDEESDNLYLISKKLKSSGSNINLSFNYETHTSTKMHINRIRMFLSKEQLDIYNLKFGLYDIVSKQSILDLEVNGHKYKWNLNEVYFQDNTIISNKFITGHSVII